MENSELNVFVYGGDPRGGKGSAVKYLSGTRPRLAMDETGADYRSVSVGLVEQGVLEEGMSPEVIEQKLATVSDGDLMSLAASREDIIRDQGLDALYTPGINSLVYRVAPDTRVRSAVKAGFIERVEKVRDSDEYDGLAVDGRRLELVVKTIKGVRALLQTFVACHPVEGALRECFRQGVPFDSPEGQQILAKTIGRSTGDATRTNDPVVIDDNALVFEHGVDLREAAVRRYAKMSRYNGDSARVRMEMDSSLSSPGRRGMLSHEIGAAAVLADRPIHFDTTAFSGYGDIEISRSRMLDEFGRMYDDALEASKVSV